LNILELNALRLEMTKEYKEELNDLVKPYGYRVMQQYSRIVDDVAISIEDELIIEIESKHSDKKATLIGLTEIKSDLNDDIFYGLKIIQNKYRDL